MKSFATAVACLAVASMRVNGESCSATTLASVVENPNASACLSSSGVSLSSIMGSLTQQQLAGLCGTDACVALLESVLATNPPDCTVPVGSGLLLRSQTIDPIVAYCTANGVAISSGSGSTGADVGSVTPSSLSSGSSTADNDAGTDNSNTSTTPASTTPAPTTGGAAGVSMALCVTLAATMAVTSALI